MSYQLKRTTAEVFAVMRASHPELAYFGSFSDPDGTWMGGPGEIGRMETEYGFKDSDIPVLKARTTWKIGKDGERIEETTEHIYWLCIGKD